MTRKFNLFTLQLKRWKYFFTNYQVLKRNLQELVRALRYGGLPSLFAITLGKITGWGSFNKYKLYQKWFDNYVKLTIEERARIKTEISQFNYKPLISIVMPTYNTAEEFLIKAIDSVRAQLYPHWELCIADDASTNPAVKQILTSYAYDLRIKIIYRAVNGHISESSNSALTLVTGEYIALLDHDDELTENALYEVVKELNKNSQLDFIYSDEDKVTETGEHFDHHFKTDWDPLLIMSANYVNHIAVYRASIIKKIGGFRKGFEGAQDHDLLLRFSAKTTLQRIHHIPRVLYHWRACEGSTARGHGEKNYALVATKKTAEAYLHSQQIDAEVVPNPYCNALWRIKFKLPQLLPKVSIVMSLCDNVDLFKITVTSLLDPKSTSYKNFELIIINNNSQEKSTYEYLDILKHETCVTVLNYNEFLNESRLNNIAAKHSTGAWLLFLNNNINPINQDWLEEMISYAALDGVAAVGAKLYYSDNTVQHPGVVLGMKNMAAPINTKIHKFNGGYHGRLFQARNCSAVTGSCLLVRKQAFQALQGFNESLAANLWDVNFCIRLIKQGYQIIWTPFAELSRQKLKSPLVNLQKKCQVKTGNEIAANCDPFYNLNFSLKDYYTDLAFPPRLK